MKKIISMICCVALLGSSLAMVGCGPKEDEGNATKVYVQLKSGGTGTQWLIDAGKRFSIKNAKTVYEDGKEGVEIKHVPVEDPSLKNSLTDGIAIYDLMGMPTIEAEARSGKVLCIDDVLTKKSDVRDGEAISPLEKISEDQRSRYMYDGHYYGGPTCEYYPSIVYDKDLFDKYGFYLADQASGVETLNSRILNKTFYFLPEDGESDMKTCGPDGEYGTDDDGLPSSIYELIALCEYIDGNSEDIAPFNFTGQYKYYSNFMLSAIYTALQGYDDAMGNYTFSGTTEIVTGFEDVALFPGANITGLRKPITKTVTLSEANGYYTTWEVNKYYAEAFMALCVNQGWFGPSVAGEDSQKGAIEKFVYSDTGSADKIAMHIDGSYWYNEAQEPDNYFEEWAGSLDLLAEEVERNVRLMPLPVNYSESVTEGHGKPQTLLEMNYGMFVINKEVEKNPGLMRAAKEFLAFLYTDAELSKYTASTSILRSMNYELDSEDEDDISSYGQNLIDLINTQGNKVVYLAADNATFKANVTAFYQSWENNVFRGNAPSFYEAYAVEDEGTVETIFKAQSTSKTGWAGMYKGAGSVTDVDGLVSLN